MLVVIKIGIILLGLCTGYLMGKSLYLALGMRVYFCNWLSHMDWCAFLSIIKVINQYKKIQIPTRREPEIELMNKEGSRLLMITETEIDNEKIRMNILQYLIFKHYFKKRIRTHKKLKRKETSIVTKAKFDKILVTVDQLVEDKRGRLFITETVGGEVALHKEMK